MNYRRECEKNFEHIMNDGDGEYGSKAFDWCFKMALLEELKHLNETLSDIKRRMFK